VKHYSSVIPGVKVWNQELKVEFPNGSRISLLGADNPDSLRGIYLDYAVLDEYADMRQGLWGEILRPALTDKRGSAIFIGTPRGHNHFYQAYQDAMRLPEWGHALYKVSDTDVLDPDELAQVRLELTDDEYRQEFECSFEAAIKGAYYGTLIEKAETDGRISRVPYDPIMPVHTAWDLGISDAMTIWFFQVSPSGEIRVIDYMEDTGEGLPYYARELDKKGYKFGKHLAPHDIRVRELGSGKSRLEIAESLGIHFDVVPNIGVMDGIDAARAVIPRCWFDEDKCRAGLESLKQYRKEYQDRLSMKGRDMFASAPLHNWASHGADAFRMLAVGLELVRDIPAVTLKMPRFASQQGWMQ
jgi:phage terminase large subunit